MNANENRNNLTEQIASMADHLLDNVESFRIAKNTAGPNNWRGTADLERVAGLLAEAVAAITGVSAEDVREEAREIAARQ
jgi:hypothetical protein